MRIHGKGKLNNQLLEKIEKGATAIEIHLEKELLEDIPLTIKDDVISSFLLPRQKIV